MRAGPLTVLYHAGSLRYVRLGSVGILRHVYFAVRDAQWRTLPFTVANESVRQHSEGFSISFEARHSDAFAWKGSIEGSAGGTIRFAVEGAPLRVFERNRIGLCILHPIAECAGQTCVVEHSGGERESTRFPKSISPHQPFFDIRSITHTVVPGVTAEVRMTGDIFEAEDHRNWTDYSFKTYSTPLSIPYPVQVSPADTVEQAVEIHLHGSPVQPPLDSSEPVSIQVDRHTRMPFPALGSVYHDGATPLRLDHLRVLPKQMEAAAAYDMPFEVALFGELTAATQPVSRYLVYAADGKLSPPELIRAAKQKLSIPVGGGSNSHFVEVNRNRNTGEGADILCWSINPHAHSTDDLTTVENLEGQPTTVHAARLFRGEPIAISPVHTPLFDGAAAWTVASVAKLASAGVVAVTYENANSILEEIWNAHPEAIIPSTSTNPLRAEALVTPNAVWLANLLPSSQAILYDGKPYSLHAYAVERIR